MSTTDQQWFAEAESRLDRDEVCDLYELGAVDVVACMVCGAPWRSLNPAARVAVRHYVEGPLGRELHDLRDRRR